MIQVMKVYTARKARLLRRMPAQPRREVMIPLTAAMVDVMSSGRFATRRMSEWVQTSNHVRRQKMRAVREYRDSCSHC